MLGDSRGGGEVGVEGFGWGCRVQEGGAEGVGVGAEEVGAGMELFGSCHFWGEGLVGGAGGGGGFKVRVDFVYSGGERYLCQFERGLALRAAAMDVLVHDLRIASAAYSCRGAERIPLLVDCLQYRSRP